MTDLLAIFITGAAFGIAIMTLLFLIDQIVEERRQANRFRYPLDDRRRWQ